MSAVVRPEGVPAVLRPAPAAPAVRALPRPALVLLQAVVPPAVNVVVYQVSLVQVPAPVLPVAVARPQLKKLLPLILLMKAPQLL